MYIFLGNFFMLIINMLVDKIIKNLRDYFLGYMGYFFDICKRIKKMQNKIHLTHTNEENYLYIINVYKQLDICY